MLSLSVNASSAPPYTLLAGEDINGDGIFNDRPAGVGRNTLRASRQMTVNMFAGYNFSVRPLVGAAAARYRRLRLGAAARVRSVDLGPGALPPRSSSSRRRI